MSDRTPPPKPPANLPARDKSGRLAEALRANLARRKAQLRARADKADPLGQAKDQQG